MSEDFILFLIPNIIIFLWLLAIVAIIWGIVKLVKNSREKNSK